MNVSVVIPAHNAAKTLAHTLESLLAQTHPAWEATLIDDGSSDGTLEIAREFAGRDTRIRVISQSCAGVSAARNAGIAQAKEEWLLFLDSDDWISPVHLERMTGVLAADPGLDAVHCGWNRVLPDGTMLERSAENTLKGDLFEVLTQRCYFAIHACLIRRALVQEVGAFDESLPTCEDWDLWQRTARTGARFGWIPDVLAFYRMRPASLSTDGRQFLADGLKVIERGHGPDPRMKKTAARHHAGISTEQLAAVKFIFVNWPSSIVMGHGRDARPLLEMLGNASDPTLDPGLVAGCIFDATLQPRALPASAWPQLWAELEGDIVSYLAALEAQAKVPLLASRALRILERMIVEHPGSPRPLTIGLTHACEIEVTAPLRNIVPPAGVERVRCDVLLEGAHIGRIWLPVCDGVVAAEVIADAIAADYAWPVLGSFFEKTVYRDLRVEATEAGTSIFRGELCLAEGLPSGAAWPVYHDSIGWAVFLQELWGCPELPEAAFHEAGEVVDLADASPAERRVVEVSRGLYDLVASGDVVELVLMAGGSVVALVNAPSLLSAAELRVRLTLAGGFELCRVAVREGLLGRAMNEHASLRARLAACCGEAIAQPDEAGLILGRHSSGVTGTSASRHARLPEEAFQELLEMAQAIGQPVFVPRDEEPREIAYSPDHLPSLVPSAPLVRSRAVPDDRGVVTARLPILMYHRVAPEGAAATARWRVTPEEFEEQLRYLSGEGYYSVSLDEWRLATEARRPLPGRAILLSFDDGYRDFATHAWPLLKRYGFTASMFLVADRIGGTNEWDSAMGETLELMDWDEILALQEEGAEFGSHTCVHPPLAGLSPAGVVRELARSRAILESRLGRPVTAFAYPYGATDPVVQHLTGACGYRFGLTCRSESARFQDPLVALPRIEIPGGLDLAGFGEKLKM